MSEPLTLTLPMPPNIANARLHWRTKHRHRTDYLNECDDRVTAGLIPPPPRRPFPRARLASVMHLGAAQDTDNAMARHKWACDWLVTRGYVVDDRRKCLEWAGFPEQIVKRDGHYRLVLTLTPLAA